MKLGIFGGTFNPIHYGHLINAEIIRSDFELDAILFIPSKKPVYKQVAGNVPAEDRFAMASLAIKGVNGLSVSRIEIDGDEPSYTINTIKKLQKKYSRDRLYLIIGTDSFGKLEAWRGRDCLLEMVSIIVMKRPGNNCMPKMDLENYDISFADNPLIDISSSMIRDRIKKGKSVKFLLPNSVIAYLQKKRLYEIYY